MEVNVAIDEIFINADFLQNKINVSISEPSIYADIDVITTGEMKYLQTINLSAGAETNITTTVTTEPYNVFLLDSSGNDITALVTIRVALVGTVYHVYITSVDALNNCKLKILY
jgi:hypothetical protein